jgi:hypothetical protein
MPLPALPALRRPYGHSSTTVGRRQCRARPRTVRHVTHNHSDILPANGKAGCTGPGLSQNARVQPDNKSPGISASYLAKLQITMIFVVAPAWVGASSRIRRANSACFQEVSQPPGASMPVPVCVQSHASSQSS